MKILQVVHTFLPKFVAGTEVYAYEISQALKRKKHDVRIVYTDPLANTYTLKRIDYEGIACYEIQKDINNVFSFEDSFQDKQVQDFFIDILGDYRPDIIHYQHLMFLSLNVIKEAKKRNIKQVISLHDFWFQCLTYKRITTADKLCIAPTLQKCVKCHADLINRSLPIAPFEITNLSGLISFIKNKQLLAALINKGRKKIQSEIDYYFKKEKLIQEISYRLDGFRKALKLVDVIIYPTKFLQNELYKWGLKGKRNLISADGIQNKYFKNLKKIKSKNLRFGYIGSIIPPKGLIILVRAWQKINQDNMILKIYGNFLDDLNYGRKIKTIINKSKNVEIMGAFKPNQIGEIFSDLDILVVPSVWYENAPLVIRNAFLANVPVIGTNLGGISELIKNRVNGLLFEKGNIEDLSNKIMYFLKNPKLRETMKDNFPKQKSIEDNAKELENLYKDLIDAN